MGEIFQFPKGMKRDIVKINPDGSFSIAQGPTVGEIVEVFPKVVEYAAAALRRLTENAKEREAMLAELIELREEVRDLRHHAKKHS